MLFKIALRNLWRNKRRSLITISAIAFGLAMLVFSSGFGDGAHGQMIEAGVRAMAGHVVVQGEGWQKKREMDIVVPDSPQIVQQLSEALPDAGIVQRVYMQGLLTSPSGSAGVAVSAVEPALEAEVGDLDEKLVEGEYLGDDPTGIVLGKALAKTLDVGLGGKVVLMVQRQGDIESQLFRVVGIFEVGIDEIDAFTAQVPLPAAQQMLGLGDDVTQISVHMPSHRHTRPALETVETTLAGVAGIDVLPWKRAMPDLYEYLVLDEAGMYVMLVVVALIVAMGILNTVLMSVLERLREFGVMLSLGATPRRLASLVMTEAFLMGTLSVVLGVSLGITLNALLAINGLDLTELAGDTGSMEAAGVAMDMHIFPDLSAWKTAIFAAIAFTMTLLAAIYPAWKAATLRPIECLQHR